MPVLDALPTVLGAAAVVPPLLYLLSITFLDKRPEPAHAVVGTFLLAALSTAFLQLLPYPATALSEHLLALLEHFSAPTVEWSDPGWVPTLAQAVIDIAAPEEAIKLLILLAFSRRFLAYDHPMEGVVYGAAVGLGLAAYENLLLAVYLTDSWREHAVIRSILTVPTHGALGIIAGVYVARAKFGNTMGAARGAAYRWRSYAAAWLVPVALHTVYNFPLLFVRNVIGLDGPYAQTLQTAGFVIGTAVVLAGARLVYRVALAQGSSTGRYGRGSLFGYRAWRLDLLGGFASLAGALMIMIEVRALLRGEPFVFDRHIGILVGAVLVVAADALHRRAARSIAAGPARSSAATREAPPASTL